MATPLVSKPKYLVVFIFSSQIHFIRFKNLFERKNNRRPPKYIISLTALYPISIQLVSDEYMINANKTKC
jgi:hypothetical protein